MRLKTSTKTRRWRDTGKGVGGREGGRGFECGRERKEAGGGGKKTFLSWFRFLSG